jgi:Na+/H+-dicarboxylate symporter
MKLSPLGAFGIAYTIGKFGFGTLPFGKTNDLLYLTGAFLFWCSLLGLQIMVSVCLNC